MSLEYHDAYQERFLPEPVHDRLVRFFNRLTGIAVLAAIIMSWMALLTWSAVDPSLTRTTPEPVTNLLGYPGAIISDLMLQSFGVACVILLLVPTLWALEMSLGREVSYFGSKLTYFLFSLLVLAGALSSLPTVGAAAWPLHHGFGGIFGDAVARIVSNLVGMLISEKASWASGLVMFAAGFVSVATAIGIGWRDVVAGFKGADTDGQTNPYDQHADATGRMQQPVEDTQAPIDFGTIVPERDNGPNTPTSDDENHPTAGQETAGYAKTQASPEQTSADAAPRSAMAEPIMPRAGSPTASAKSEFVPLAGPAPLTTPQRASNAAEGAAIVDRRPSSLAGGQPEQQPPLASQQASQQPTPQPTQPAVPPHIAPHAPAANRGTARQAFLQPGAHGKRENPTPSTQPTRNQAAHPIATPPAARSTPSAAAAGPAIRSPNSRPVIGGQPLPSHQPTGLATSNRPAARPTLASVRSQSQPDRDDEPRLVVHPHRPTGATAPTRPASNGITPPANQAG
ncbi:MAG: DNA translocase FtsK 4TM domain-containing protein, partial [Pseudomonadota bacterium]